MRFVRARLSLVAPLLVVGTSACSTFQLTNHNFALMRAISSPDRCRQLDSKVTGLHVAAVLLGGLGVGINALAMTFSSTVTRDSLLGGGELSTLGGTVAGYLAGKYAADFTKECP